MIELPILNSEGKQVDVLKIDEAVLGGEIRHALLKQAYVVTHGNQRQGSPRTKSRGSVEGSTRKLYKQKGTGQARHGAANAPIFRGGGHAHNILPRDYAHDLTKKVRAMALRHALSSKAGAKEIIVIDAAKLDAPKTADLRKKLAKLGVENALFIAGAEVDDNFALAARNIPNLDVLPNAGLNVYDILRRKHLVLTKDAVEAINARFADKKEAA